MMDWLWASFVIVAVWFAFDWLMGITGVTARREYLEEKTRALRLQNDALEDEIETKKDGA